MIYTIVALILLAVSLTISIAAIRRANALQRRVKHAELQARLDEQINGWAA